MAGSVAELTDELFDSTVVSPGKTFLVDFWGEGCAPCERLTPIMHELAEEYGDKLQVGKCNIYENIEVATRFGVAAVPTLLIFKSGDMVERIVGAYPKAKLKTILDKHL